MREALRLAARGEGRVEPNPMVGCVLARDGRIVGRGFHARFGGPHAEVIALRQAGAHARGATAYVSLEPCCHHGKTPPCTEALIAAHVSRVIYAMPDPNPVVAGRGARRLAKAGIGVKEGLLRDDAARLNAPFITYMIRRRPYFILKWAQSVDGKIATRTGDSKWITSPESRRAAHALRARVDAVLVGVGTVLADDPDLTARLAPAGNRTGWPQRIAARVILDTRLRTPLTARVVRTARRVPTIVFTDAGNQGGRRWRQLEAAGCRLEAAPVRRGAHFGPVPSLALATSRRRSARRSGASARRPLPEPSPCLDIHAVAARLRELEMTNVLIEGGGRVLGSFFDAGLADEARIFVAPKLIGGESAPGPLRCIGPAAIHSVHAVDVERIAPCGPDLLYRLRFRV